MRFDDKEYRPLINYIKKHPDTVFRDLAEKFGCSISTARAAYYCVFPGSVPPASRRANKREARRASALAKKTQNRQQALEYARANPDATYSEISERFGIAMDLIQYSCIGAGLHNDNRLPQSYCDRGLSVKDLESERCKTIRKAIEEDWTLKELGAAFGVTRERARQLILLYQHIHGPIERPKTRSVSSLADELGVTKNALLKLVKMHGLGRPRGSNQHVLTEDEAKELPNLIMLAKKSECGYCKKVFFCKKLFMPTAYCSPSCMKKGIYERSRVRSKSPITEDNADKYAPLVKKIKSSDAGAVYIPLKEAKSVSGATSMQLVYLRNRGLIRTQPSKSGVTRNGIPHRDYSLDDVKKLGEFLQETK